MNPSLLSCNTTHVDWDLWQHSRLILARLAWWLLSVGNKLESYNTVYIDKIAWKLFTRWLKWRHLIHCARTRRILWRRSKRTKQILDCARYIGCELIWRSCFFYRLQHMTEWQTVPLLHLWHSNIFSEDFSSWSVYDIDLVLSSFELAVTKSAS